MNKVLTCRVAALMSFAAMAAQHSAAEAEVLAAVKAFNGACASNDVDRYFSHYSDDAADGNGNYEAAR